ncbi:MAG: pyridoxal phosphate-dependent aminotransferase [Myxococcales bacterium]|nr:pyridoxal phosphate-dependent aminotransferase [Myxococcales bacterium]MCB9754742.1 pyridoxal phosphate-dependent aminotransferase [Myxococcales bacterium]
MVHPKLSVRGATSPASPIRRLMPHADFARSRGVHVHHLNIGQPDLPTVSTMRAAYQRFAEPVVAYSPSQGFAEYREALAGYYNGLGAAAGGPAINADQILVTTGGSEALLFAIATACDPGDSILVVEPYYTNYRGFAHMLGVEVVPVTSFASEGFSIPAERVRAAIRARTRALVVPTPGNPTGAVLTHEALAALGAVCREHGLFFIVDEVYREFVYPEDGDLPEVAPSVLGLPDLTQHAIVIDSVSKRYSACGARVGCLVTRNAYFYAACLRFAQARLSPPTVDQHAAMAALETPAAEMRGMIDEYRRRRDLLVDGLRAIPGVSCPTPRGAFYLVADLPVDDAEAFCTFLLREFSLEGETVMMAPAEGFYATPGKGRNQVRIAYVLGRERLARCLTILRAGLAAYAARPRSAARSI